MDNGRVITFHRGSSQGSGLNLLIDGPGGWSAYAHDGSTGSSIFTSSYPETNRWYYLAVTHDGTTHKFWVDMDLIGTQSRGFSLGSFTAMIGHYNNLTSIYAWDGWIAGIRVTNRAKSEAELENYFYGMRGY